jgi:hypothetical protein
MVIVVLSGSSSSSSTSSSSSHFLSGENSLCRPTVCLREV